MKFKHIIASILNSYSQIFFSKNKVFAAFLLVVSFFDLWLGIAGFVSVLVANGLALLMGYDEKTIKEGIYGFNPLLTGLAVGIYFAASWNALILVVIVSILTLFVSFVLQGMLSKYALPFLSLPFLLAVWFLSLAFAEFTNIGISAKDIYTYNDLYSVGGLKLIQAYEFMNNFPIAESLKTYFLSLGAIFFQFNILAGFVIAIGLLIYSRQAFLMSLIGFYAAYAFYNFLGIPAESLNHTYFGFNFILSAIAIGSYFLIPSYKSLIWTILIIPILVIITIGSDKIIGKFFLPVYSFPFNIVVLGFIYSLKLRVSPKKGLVSPIIHQKTPEQTAYFYKNALSGENLVYGIRFSLPFFGKWSVSQGVDGEYTHKDAWKHAWDFVITDNENSQFRNNGNDLSDYYCYDKPIVSVADGTVVEVIDGIEDNIVGDINLKQNWGNTIIVQHGIGIFSQYSHLKNGSFKVNKGMFVSKGQQLAAVGNSGRSPYPHLHFQFQKTAVVGCKTAEVSFNNYLVFSENEQKIVRSGVPSKNDVLSNIESMFVLKKMLQFIPGSQYQSEYTVNDKKVEYYFFSDTDIYNNSFLTNKNEKSKMYFSYDNSVFNAINFLGPKISPLFLIFNTLYFVSFGFYKKVSFTDKMPLHINNNKFLVTLQDFFVNMFVFLRTEYKNEFIEVDDEFNPNEVKLKAEISNYLFNKKISSNSYSINLKSGGKSTIEFSSKRKNIKLVWERKS